jgi:hypothetical protein
MFNYDSLSQMVIDVLGVLRRNIRPNVMWASLDFIMHS